MLLPRRNKKWSSALTPEKIVVMSAHLKKFLVIRRKEMLSPFICIRRLRRPGAFFFAPLRASLTVEAAMVLPLFLFCMTAALQYCRVMDTAVRLAGALTDTGKEMAAAAYQYEYPEDAGQSWQMPGLVTGTLSSVWAQSRVMKAAGDTSDIKNANMTMSSFLTDGQMIDLVMTYQIRSPFQMISLPGYYFLQRANVRAWTGRLGGQQGEEEDKEEKTDEIVYVTKTGSVYHEDPECTYLKLSYHEVDRSTLGGLRNNGGEKYSPCERCKEEFGDKVYITDEGNRYHASLTCSGLKRTVLEISREEAEEHLRACSKCAGS